MPTNIENGPHLLSKCTLTNNTGYGFVQERRVIYKLADLLIAGNGSYGIYDPGYSSTVYGWNLTIVSNKTYGIALSAGGGNGGNTMHLYNSILADNTTAGLRASGSNPSSACFYNVLIDQATPFAYTDKKTPPTQTDVTFEAAKLVADGKRRWHLCEDSPARKLGKYSRLSNCPFDMTHDLDGYSRSKRYIDAGCFRYDLPGLLLLVR